MNRQCRVGVAWAAMTLVGLSTGCVAGPVALKASRARYNEAIQHTNAEQLLLNLVRLRYHESPLFLEVGSVSAQFTFDGSADATGTLVEGPTSVAPDRLELSAGIGYSERPTVTLAPLQGKDYAERILTPLSLDALVLLSRSGWSIDRIFRLTVQRMNGLDNASSASGPTPAEAPPYKDFAKVTQLFRTLQKARVLEIGYEEVPVDPPLTIPASQIDLSDAVAALGQGYGLRTPEDGQTVVVTQAQRTLVWRVSSELRERADVRELVDLLGLDPVADKYVLRWTFSRPPDRAATKGKTTYIDITTRSLMGVLFYLSQAVDVPAAHYERGWVMQTHDASGRPFDWADVTGEFLNVHVRGLAPADPAVTVPYRGYWFYVDNADLASKATFGLLGQLLALQAGGAEAVTPVLTLPVGG